MKRCSLKDMLVIGFALFSMYFGAGNLLFPPFLGLTSGSHWLLGFVCYYIADIGLAILAMYAIFKQGSANGLVSPIGKIPTVILMSAIVLCIGPMLAIPRTAAMTFEMAVEPLTSSVNGVVSSILFFALILLCSIRENKVVDIVGKIMSPLLLIGLVVMIVLGVVKPLGSVADSSFVSNVAGEGIKAGYQTMDVLATMMFGAVILHSAEAKGYTDSKPKNKIAGGASLVAGAVLLVIYGGLTYLGASLSADFDPALGRSSLILHIVNGLLGNAGTVVFAIVVALACVTTAVGLVSACSTFFSDISGGKISYKLVVVITCVFSAIVSNVGLDQIISIAAPILDIVYPPTLVLVILGLLPELPKLTHRLGVLGALVMSVLGVISTYGGVEMAFLDQLPLASLGFGWLIPTAICSLLGLFLGKSGGKGKG